MQPPEGLGDGEDLGAGAGEAAGAVGLGVGVWLGAGALGGAGEVAGGRAWTADAGLGAAAARWGLEPGGVAGLGEPETGAGPALPGGGGEADRTVFAGGTLPAAGGVAGGTVAGQWCVEGELRAVAFRWGAPNAVLARAKPAAARAPVMASAARPGTAMLRGTRRRGPAGSPDVRSGSGAWRPGKGRPGMGALLPGERVPIQLPHVVANHPRWPSLLHRHRRAPEG
ncbi:MAG TPA: hypothetical protein VKY26_00965 [Actinomycetota bacterium]|nr:hypothetical protein [Actinomycetota bacterium]